MCVRLDHASVVVVGCSDGGTSIIQLAVPAVVVSTACSFGGGCGKRPGWWGWLGTLLGPEASGTFAGALSGFRSCRCGGGEAAWGLWWGVVSWFRPCRPGSVSLVRGGGGLWFENFTVDASVFVVCVFCKLLRAHGGCLGIESR